MKRLLPVALVFASATLAAAQGPISPFGSYKSFGPDVVDRSLLGVQLGIPVYTKPTLNGGRLSLVLNYDSSEVWTTTAGGGAWVPVPGAGWYLSSPASATLTSDSYGATCGWYDPDWGDDPDTGAPDDQSDEIVTYNFTLTEPDGTAVPNLLSYFVVNGNTTHPPRWDPDGDGPWVNDCPTPTSLPESQVVADGKGFSVSIDASGDAAAYDRNGDRIDDGFTDANGNSLEQLGWSEGTSGSATPGNYLIYSWPGPNDTGPFVQEDFIAINVSTDFGGGTTPYSGTMTVPSDLKFPDGSTYTFTYTSDGRLATMTLPAGGVVSYGYGAISILDFGSASLTRSDNVSGGTWQWTRVLSGPNLTPITTETTPDANNSVYTFGAPPTANGADMLNEVDTYQGTVGPNNLLQTVTIADTPAGGMPSQQVITTELATPGGTPAPVYAARTLTLDAYGDQTGETNSDWGASPTGQATLRTVATPYEYAGNGLRPASSLVKDGAGNQVSQSTFSYDGHGNLQSENDYTSASAYLTRSWSYNPNGTVSSATDYKGAVTSTTYGACNGLFPTLVQSPVAAVKTTLTWNCSGGVETSTEDGNNQTTVIKYNDPSDTWRPSEVDYPDGGETTFAYTPTTLETKRLQDTQGDWEDALTTFDGLGRDSADATETSAGVWSRVETCYNGMGEKATVTYPFYGAEGGVGACTQPGDQFTWDALGRPLVTTHSPDNSKFTMSYAGRATETQDEGNGTTDVTHISQVNGLGQLTNVCEVTSATDAAGNVPNACGLDLAANGFLTTYTHDPLGNLTQVVQGAETRNFQYDGLSRLLSATNPENGATTWTYDADSNVLTRTRPAPNQTGSATVTTTYGWDALNRLTSKTYSDQTTPAISLGYDQSSVWWPIANPIGRLTYADAVGVAQEGWSYDPMGRPLHSAICTPQTCGTSGFDYLYQYDLAGDATVSDYARGATLTTSFDLAGRPTGVTSSWSDSGHPATLVSGLSYNAAGNETAASLGDGMQEQHAYDARLRLTSDWVGPSTESINPAAPPNAALEANTAALGQYGVLQTSGWAVDPADGSPVARVEVLVDGRVMGNATLGGARPDVASGFGRGDDALAGWSFSGSIGNLAPGTHTVSAVAVDRLGNQTTAYYPGNAGALSVTTNTPPVGFEDTESGTSVAQGGTETIYGWAADNEDGAPVKQVQIEVDGVVVGSASLGMARPDVVSGTGQQGWLDSGWSYTLNVGSLAPGPHSFTAVAYDSAGAATALPVSTGNTNQFTVTGSAAVFGYFNNIPPSSSYGGSISVGGWAADPVLNAGASKVEFRVDGKTIAQAPTGGSRPDVASAYNDPGYGTSGFQTTFPLGNVTPGGHTLTVWAYDSLGVAARQIDSIHLNVTGGNAYSLELTRAPDGDVSQDTDSANGSWIYGFDDLNRLVASTCTSPGCPGGTSVGYQYLYDRYGNRWQQDYADGSQAGAQLTFTSDSNRPDNWSFDAAGNLMSDGHCNYTYDAENRLIGVSLCQSASYKYDPEGRRVWENVNGTVKEFVYGASGQEQTVVDANQNLQQGEVFLGSRHVATYTPAATYFEMADSLGTARARSDQTGNLAETCQSLPFGDNLSCQGIDPSPLHFTGQYLDAETSLSYFPFRYLNPSLARWMSPDPAGLAAVDPSDPQSWNRYAYVTNQPLEYTDPLGLFQMDCTNSVATNTPCAYFSTSNLGEGYGDYSYEYDADAAWWNLFNDFDPYATLNSETDSGEEPQQKQSLLTTVWDWTKKTVGCASDFGDKYSIAGGLNALGIGNNGGIGGFLTNALGGNAVSGLVGLVAQGGSAAQLAFSGTHLGMGGSTLGQKGLGGAIQEGIVGGAFSAVTGAGEGIQSLNGFASIASTGIEASSFAYGVGELKVGIDATIFGAGVLACAAGW